jgi:hypothetical protein
VSQVESVIANNLPDAPRAIYVLDAPTRRKLERAFKRWPPKGAFVDADESDQESWRPAERAAREWVAICGLRMPFLSENTQRSRTKPQVRRVLTPIPRSAHEARTAIAGPRFDHHPSDSEAVLAVTSAGDETFSIDNRQASAGVALEPNRNHWRVARAGSHALIRLVQNDGPAWTVSNAMRLQARDATATLLGVAYFSEAMRTEIARATRICDRWLDVRSGGLPRWQAAIVWTIERHHERLSALREAADFESMSTLIREVAGHIAVLPEGLSGEPTLSLANALDIELTIGRGTRRAVSAHGLAYRWCDAHGVEFPPYRSSQRLRGSARRVSAAK